MNEPIVVGASTRSEHTFAFGKNWRDFIATIDDIALRAAEDSLRSLLGVDNLKGKQFLDAGSGSGLLSLAAVRMGAKVRSFDADLTSIACTRSLKERYEPDNTAWSIETGSVLDKEYLLTLGQFDIVYCWGVLHHTGAMMESLDNVLLRIIGGGKLVVAIYNDQGIISRYWKAIKRLYNRNDVFRFAVVTVHSPYLILGRWVTRMITGRPRPDRGMSLWYDMKDWLGGYPFEVAKPEEIIHFCQARGFRLTRLKTCGGRHGCNEYVFVKDSGCR